MQTPSKHTIEALAALEHDRDFQQVIEWVSASLVEAQESLIQESDTARTRQLQGQCQALQEFKKLASEARQHLTRSR